MQWPVLYMKYIGEVSGASGTSDDNSDVLASKHDVTLEYISSDTDVGWSVVAG